jgi:DNA-binding MarR family transcriptional regulator
VFNAVKAHLQQVERLAGVGGAQVWALSIITDRAGPGINELAAAQSVRQPTASNLVKALVQQDLIELRREAEDRRAVQLHILPAGRQRAAPRAGAICRRAAASPCGAARRDAASSRIRPRSADPGAWRGRARRQHPAGAALIGGASARGTHRFDAPVALPSVVIMASVSGLLPTLLQLQRCVNPSSKNCSKVGN